MAVIKVNIDDNEYEILKKIATNNGYNSVEEFIKSFLKTNVYQTELPKIFYKGASKKFKIDRFNREEVYDRK